MAAGGLRTFHRARRKPEISIAPLIDVVFLLVIFFAVTTTFTRETGVDINRPTAAKAGVLPGQSLLIGIDKDGGLWMEGGEVELSQIRRIIAERLERTEDLNIVVVADKESLTGRVVDVLDECKQAGAKKLSIAAKVEHPEELE